MLDKLVARSCDWKLLYVDIYVSILESYKYLISSEDAHAEELD